MTGRKYHTSPCLCSLEVCTIKVMIVIATVIYWEFTTYQWLSLSASHTLPRLIFKFGRQVLLLTSYRWQIWGSEKSMNLVQSHTGNKGQKWNLNWGQFYSKAILFPIILHCSGWSTIPFHWTRGLLLLHPILNFFRERAGLQAGWQKQWLGNKLALTFEPMLKLKISTKSWII